MFKSVEREFRYRLGGYKISYSIFDFDKNKDFSEQNISTEACEIFIKLYIKYIADEKQREGIKEMLELNELMNENNKRN